MPAGWPLSAPADEIRFEGSPATVGPSTIVGSSTVKGIVCQLIGDRLLDVARRQRGERDDERAALRLLRGDGLLAGRGGRRDRGRLGLVRGHELHGRGHRHAGGDARLVSGLVVGSARNAVRMLMPHAEPDWMWPPAGNVMLKAFVRPAATLSPPSVQVAGSMPPWSTSAGMSDVTSASELSGSCGTLSAAQASSESRTLSR